MAPLFVNLSLTFRFKGGGVSLAESKLLIVDDESGVRELLAATLADSAHHIDTAKDGREALAMLKADLGYHAVLTDIRMPNLDGLEMLDQMRKSNIQIPVVILTAFGDEQKALEALRLGAFDFLDKPWRDEHLVSVVCRALELGVQMACCSDSKVEMGDLLKVYQSNQANSMRLLEGSMQSVIRYQAEAAERIGIASKPTSDTNGSN